MGKNILIILLSILMIGSLGYLTYLYLQRESLNSQIRILEIEMDRFTKLEDKEEKIKNMSKTLLIHYGHLSWYEAYYYSVIIYDFSYKYNLPWEMYAALMRIESNFDPTAKSVKGAKGLTQVIEPTGKSVAEELGIQYKEGLTLWNDILNIIIGFTYFSEGAQKAGLEDGIKRYNGGPGFKKGHKGIGIYRTTVWQEYLRLKYIYNGVINDTEEEEDFPKLIQQIDAKEELDSFIDSVVSK